MRKTTIRNRVRELRTAAGYTSQEALADKLDVTRQTVLSIESGRYNPSLELAIRIARLFNTPVEEVFLVDDSEPVEATQQ